MILEPKVDKVSGATENNFATFNANGGIKDSEKKASDFATSDQGKKADTALQPVSGATENNFAAFDSSGKIFDSGKKASDFASASEVTTARGEFANLNARLENIEDAALTHRYGI